MKSSPLQLGQQRVRRLIVFHDVTYLRDKDRARTNLVATLSHELKTPLTSLSLAIELLQRNANDGRQRETLEAIADDLARIRDLSESLLNITRDETASITVRNITFDFAKLVASLVRKFALQAAQKQISLRAHVGEDLVSYGDPVKRRGCAEPDRQRAAFHTGRRTIDDPTRSEHSLRLSVGTQGRGSPEIAILSNRTPYPLDAVGGSRAGSRDCEGNRKRTAAASSERPPQELLCKPSAIAHKCQDCSSLTTKEYPRAWAV